MQVFAGAIVGLRFKCASRMAQAQLVDGARCQHGRETRRETRYTQFRGVAAGFGTEKVHWGIIMRGVEGCHLCVGGFSHQVCCWGKGVEGGGGRGGEGGGGRGCDM